jgi:hypothetical protein
MFQQVSNTIEQMLNSLSYIYQSHGIKFIISDLQKILFRLLTPFELLSYFHLIDNDAMIDKKSDNYWQFREKIKNMKIGSFGAKSN